MKPDGKTSNAMSAADQAEAIGQYDSCAGGAQSRRTSRVTWPRSYEATPCTDVRNGVESRPCAFASRPAMEWRPEGILCTRCSRTFDCDAAHIFSTRPCRVIGCSGRLASSLG